MNRVWILMLSLSILISSCASRNAAQEKRGEPSMEKLNMELKKMLFAISKEPRALTWQTEASKIINKSTQELASEIQSGALSSEEVVVSFLERIITLNPAYNAIVTLNAESALARAREADQALRSGIRWGPLHGVPFTIKDTYQTAGVRTSAGYPPLKDFIPEENAVVVQRLLDAGAILLGKTNTPTLAMDMQTTNPIFGVTGNSVNPDWSAGGSSGGASVAVALRMTPFEFGSDLAGSIRLPAAFNGVYGLRPSHGLVSMRGHIPPLPTELNGIRRMAVAGPITHTLADLEFLLRIVAGPGPGDYRVKPLQDTKKAPLSQRPLKVVWADNLGGIPVETEIQNAMATYIEQLANAGVSVQKGSPPDFPYEKAWETWGAFVGLQGGYEQSNFMRSLGDFFTKATVANTPMQRKIVGPISVPGYMQAMEIQDQCIDILERFTEPYDVFIVPVASVTAFPHFKSTRTFGNFSVYDAPMKVNAENIPYYVATQSYTTLFSLTESPVITLPIGHDKKGAPIGIQLVGRRFHDLELIRVAEALEQIVTPPRKVNAHAGKERSSFRVL